MGNPARMVVTHARLAAFGHAAPIVGVLGQRRPDIGFHQARFDIDGDVVVMDLVDGRHGGVPFLSWIRRAE
jgi:hypothetical protein